MRTTQSYVLITVLVYHIQYNPHRDMLKAKKEEKKKKKEKNKTPIRKTLYI
jgi:hypothetical protein